MRHYTTPRRREKAPTSLNKINSSVRPPLAAAASAAAMKALHSPAKEEENESVSFYDPPSHIISVQRNIFLEILDLEKLYLICRL